MPWMVAGLAALSTCAATARVASAASGGIGGLAGAGAATPTGATTRLQAGFVALEQSRYRNAETELGAVAAQQGPERVPAWIGLARVQLATGRYEQAAATAQQAMQAAPQGSSAQAAAQLPGHAGSNSAPAQWPVVDGTKAEAAAVRAEALMRLGKLREAISLLEPLQQDATARRAKLLLGQCYLRTGRRADATQPLMAIIEDYNQGRIATTDPEGLSLVGRAAQLLGSPRDANDAYNEAERVGGKRRVETLLWRAELFLDKYDPGHAEEVVREALALAPDHPQAHVVMASVKLDQALDFKSAEQEVEKAWRVDPKIQGAFFVAAGLALRTMDLARAEDILRRGLAINPEDLELLSMRAATSFLADDRSGFASTKKQVFDKNPEYARFYEIVGEFAEWEHRYDEIVTMMRDAVRIDPEDAKAWAELGLNAIRAGDEQGGLSALRRAWQKDHYNVRVYNTLNLFEKGIATSYETVDGTTFRIRYHKDEKAILERYAPGMLSAAWGTFVQRYGITPPTPIAIELYASTEQFSVRTSGLPNVGIQGVCFGRTLAALSPKAQAFNWGNILWHELAHVFAIQLSKSRVPRWFTEGLSEYETIVQRPEWSREEDPGLYVALKAGRIPPIEHFNEAFTHADDTRDVTMAYYAASQFQIYLAETFGVAKIVAMLKGWGEGRKTSEVIDRSLGVPSSELDARFRNWLAKRLSRYDRQFVPDEHTPSLETARNQAETHPANPRAHVELALILLKAKNAEEAAREIERALAIDPLEPNALFVRARLQRATGAKDASRATLMQMVKQGTDGYAVRMLLAALAQDRKDLRAVEFELRLAHEFDSSMEEPISGLYDIAKQQGRADQALDWLAKGARLNQHDRKLHGLLLSGLVEAKRYSEAVQAGEAALFVDVENPAVHSLFATALSETKDHTRAAFELESALLLTPTKPAQADLHARLAKEWLALGNPSRARTERDEALRVDPTNAAAKSLKLP